MREGVWSASEPLVLASKSPTRRALLESVGLFPEIVPPDVDERELEQKHLADGRPAEELAAALAKAKAMTASFRRPDAYCLGADQTLLLDGLLLHKPVDQADAEGSIVALVGRTHRLISAFCLTKGGRIIGADSAHADLAMRRLDARTIETYLKLAGPAVLSSVGAYQAEGLGAHLFESIEGDHSTILGLPMLKLLRTLRAEGLISL